MDYDKLQKIEVNGTKIIIGDVCGYYMGSVFESDLYIRISEEEADLLYKKVGWKCTTESIKKEHKNSIHVFVRNLQTNEPGWLDAADTRMFIVPITKMAKLLYGDK